MIGTDTTQNQAASSEFFPCTWEEVRLAQARRFATWTPDEKLDWLMSLLQLFPKVSETARSLANEQAQRF